MKIGHDSGASTNNNVVSFVALKASESPSKNAFLFYKTLADGSIENNLHTISFSEFYTNTQALAGGFSKVGITKGDVVLVFLPMSPELYTTIAGLQYIGAIPAFLDSWTNAVHFEQALKNSKPVAIVSPPQILESYAPLLDLHNVSIRISTDTVENTAFANLTEVSSMNNDVLEITPVHQEDTALITYTTGSSGVPKGADRTHRFLTSQHHELRRLFPYTEDDIDMPVFPIFALNSLASGVSIAIPNFAQEVNPSKSIARIAEQLEETKATCLTLAPSVFNGLAMYSLGSKKTFPSLRRVLTGGAPISEHDLELFQRALPQVEVQVLYGSTEVEPIAHISSQEMLSIMSTCTTDKTNPTTQGVVVGKIEEELQYAFIQPNTPKICEKVTLASILSLQGEIGELIVSGEHVCKNYYNDDDAFFRTKIVDTSGITWHRTGDLGVTDENAYLWIVGRVHNLVQKNGKYYYPVRPEIWMKDIEGVINAAYLNKNKEGEGKVVAVITFDCTLSDDRKEKISIDVKEKLTLQNIPVDEVIVIESIPMDIRHHSKVDYSALRLALQ